MVSTHPPTVLLLGGTGGIGRQVLTRLLDRGCHVKVIVRSAERLPNAAKGHNLLTVIEEPQGHMAIDLREHVQCDAIVQCLGHNLSFKGMFGHPRRLCAETVKRLCEDIYAVAPPKPIKLIVINTEGVSCPDGSDEKTLRRGCCESCVLGILKCCLPPHADNVDTSAYLHHEARKNQYVTFCAVRPSDLTDEEPSEFSVHDTLQNGIFNAGTTSRANVGEFMTNLVTQQEVWSRWENSYPHILDVKTEATVA
mmetsp:Transcript_7492/g.12583  ORF Transcript_7492/g.12583 Transcript_7492/m.12583 type:complete len:252 (-) Transcript_7492:157-912(-)|eukprot:CAMPEP_0114417012 /NCGR_PEP_ID=MMETSP0103-20121206/2734_1 /TAXON_ID=37642 ORGANISM="Paraphysomonas imperforata, Strain PA2" /NCGR_SAMPLE_ID=MMETSP0103 /ASSEMBLY_ACC=CAM_ASM_000201 /LENGTH=251 /DNA_ID=CAMNT_0001585271 /DNA_START=91 /DNA_END=846 /DNA_ORIENTATION=+